MKDTFYFSHDYNARSDKNIKRLLVKYGYQGYGIYWALIEDLYQNDNELPLDYDVMAYDLRIDVDMVKSIINDFSLFVANGNFFGSLSIERRMDERQAKSKKASDNAKKRWGELDTRIKADDCIFYVLRFYDADESFIKCGITTESVSRRYSGKTNGYQYELLYQQETTVRDGLALEGKINKTAKKYEPKSTFPGYLECYDETSHSEILEMAMLCECNGITIKESKGKQSIVKEKKEKKILSIKPIEDILEQFKTHYRAEWHKTNDALKTETDQDKQFYLKKALYFMSEVPKYIIDNDMNFVASMQGQFTLKGIMQNKELLDVELVKGKLLGAETSDTVKGKKSPTLNLTVMNWIKRDTK